MQHAAPEYSICMCNYNMADTLARSLDSILSQIDERFEVVLADDGSSDNSVKVAEAFREHYTNLRILRLKRDAKRKLGLTRNQCIKAARGSYILTNIDCDDVYGPHINDFTIIFHQLERAYAKKFFLKGNNINMASRAFLLEHGPYRNIFRGEDRDMWLRLADADAFLPLVHQNFVTRLPKSKASVLQRGLFHTWDDLQNMFRTGAHLFPALVDEFRNFVSGYRTPKSFVLRLFLILPARIASFGKERFLAPESMRGRGKFQAYRNEKRGTFKELMQRVGAQPDFSVLSEAGKVVFNTPE